LVVNDGQTPQNNPALMRQQKNKEELAAKFKQLGIPVLNSKDMGPREDSDSDTDLF